MKGEDLFDYAEKEDGKRFLKKVGEFRDSAEFSEFRKFVTVQQKHRPFNALLLWRQRPGLHAAFTNKQWHLDYNRVIKKGKDIYPLIYFNRTPYGLVWDLKDTEGPQIPDDINDSPHSIEIDEDQLSKLYSKVYKKFFFPVIEIGLDEIHEENESPAEFYAEIKWDFEPVEINHIRIHINKDKSTTDKFYSIIHELAHFLLGHIEISKDYRKKLGEKFKPYIKRKEIHMHDIMEAECELVVFFVCGRMGQESQTQSYLVRHTKFNFDKHFNEIDLDVVLNVTGRIEDLVEKL